MINQKMIADSADINIIIQNTNEQGNTDITISTIFDPAPIFRAYLITRHKL